MEQEPGASGSSKEEPLDHIADVSASGAGEAGGTAAPAPSLAQRMSFRSVMFAAVASAVLGSVVLGICEHAVSMIFFPIPMHGESWPGDLVVAATGRMIVTYVLFWIPVLVVCGGFYWLVARRRTAAAPEPFLLALFVLLAGWVVLPADLELAHRLEAILVIPGLIVGLGLALGTYFLTRSVRRRVGHSWFQGLFQGATGLAVIVVVATVFFFVRSPLLDPGAGRVAGGSARNTTRQPPSVLWIVLDTARADWLSVCGYDRPTTPFLEDWAKRSILFDRAIADGMWTLPSHGSMFTGLAARTHGLGTTSFALEESFQTVAEALRDSGYSTGCFSNNVLVGPKTNLSQGFDTFLAPYDFHHATRFSLEFLCERWGITPPVPWLDLDYGAALTNELVVRWLDVHADTPVFVFINYMEAHLPYRSPRCSREAFMSADQVHRSYDLRRRVYGELAEFLNIKCNVDGYDEVSPFDREVIKRQYEAGLRYLDQRVGEVIDVFARRGLLENTLVVITSDHGEYLGTHGMWSHHYLAYQDVIHVPILLRAPGGTDPQRIETLVLLSDLCPTVLRATLGDFAAETGRYTRDLLEVAARGGEGRIVISECFGAEPSLRPRLLAKNDPELRHRATMQIAVVDSRFKYLRSADGTRELYDLVNDPGELQNLEYSHWKEAQRLDRYVEQWLRAVPKHVPKPGGEGAKPDRELLETLRALGYVGGDE